MFLFSIVIGASKKIIRKYFKYAVQWEIFPVEILKSHPCKTPWRPIEL
jgi:hypothetical protein